MYYDIFETDTHVEYHTSHLRHEVEAHASMNRRVPIDHPEVDERVRAWHADAEAHRCELVAGVGSIAAA